MVQLKHSVNVIHSSQADDYENDYNNHKRPFKIGFDFIPVINNSAKQQSRILTVFMRLFVVVLLFRALFHQDAHFGVVYQFG